MMINLISLFSLSTASTLYSFNSNAPGQIFDLSSWKLQLPVSNGKGSVLEIKQPELATYNSTFFYTDEESSMSFWVPVGGATTPHSHNPRSELRQLNDWTMGQGKHYMSVQLKVKQVSSTGVTCVGQVHTDGVSGSCSVVLMLEWDNGKLWARLRDQECNTVSKKLGEYALNETIKYEVTMDGSKLQMKTEQESVEYDYSFAKYQVYFKVGNYLQDHKSLSGGGLVSVYALETQHQE